jgi:hypothetical protein
MNQKRKTEVVKNYFYWKGITMKLLFLFFLIQTSFTVSQSTPTKVFVAGHGGVSYFY